MCIRDRFLGGDKVRVRTFGEPKDYDLSGKNDLPADLEKLIVTLRDKYRDVYKRQGLLFRAKVDRQQRQQL